MNRHVMALMLGLALHHGAAQAQTKPDGALEQLELRAQLHAARVENAHLRSALAEAQARLVSAQLTAERAQLEAEIRQAFGCAADAPVNWQAFTETGEGIRACVPAEPDGEKPKQ